MVKVKICGLTLKEDIEFLEKFPVDYVGFILYPPSPRYVGNKIYDLVDLVKKPKKVAVFVDPIYEEVKKLLDQGIDLVQLHGEEPLELAKKIGFKRVIKAFRIKEDLDFKKFLEELELWRETYALLLDTYKKGIPGGTGESFNWEIAKKVVERDFKFFLAGGLTPEKVPLALKEINPYGIDLSSGLEKEPGVKDPVKIQSFFRILENLKEG